MFNADSYVRRIKAIDVHSHYNFGHPGDTPKVPNVVDENIEYLLKMAEAANIEYTFTSPFSGVTTEGITTNGIVDGNEHLYELSHAIKNLYQWVVIDARNEKSIEQAKRMLPHPKCAGIKVIPSIHGYSSLDYQDEIYGLAAEYGKPVLIHPEGFADYLVPVADKYKDTIIIAAHLSQHGQVEAIEKCKYGNIYTDTSSSSSTCNRVIEYAVGKLGSDRIMLGTDTYAAGFQRGRIEFAMISDKDKENILRGTAQKLFADILK